MVTNDFIIRFYPQAAQHQRPGSRAAGSVRPITVKGCHFLKGPVRTFLTVLGKNENVISELWTDERFLKDFFLTAVEAGMNFAVIQS